MRVYLLIFLILINITSSAFACLSVHKIEESFLNQYPIIAYLNKEKDNTSFYLYFKDEGKFRGLNSVSINILSDANESIFSGSLVIDKHHEKPILLHVGFSVNNKSIPFTTIEITARQDDRTNKTWIHSHVFTYDIKLKDIFDIFSGDKISSKTHTLYNKYNDEKLDKFLKSKFE